MKKQFSVIAITGLCAFAAASAQARTVGDFCDAWEFSRDQRSWRAVEVPHDWAVEGPFEPEGENATGKLPWKGVGYYRKTIVLDAAPEGRVFLDFDGVMCDGTVYVNGQPCAHQPYGYLGIRADATPYLFAGTNVVSVTADTTKLRSRWYPGAGIYRRVRRIDTAAVYLDDADVFVSPTVDAKSDGRTWKVAVKGSVANVRLADTPAKIEVLLKSPDGKVVAKGRGETKVPGFGKGSFAVTLSVRDPKLWDMKPGAALYTAEISAISDDGKSRDELSVRTGFRSFKFDPENGFFLNGRRVALQGACLHSDLGILGMAFNPSAMRRELSKLVDMGVNAIRTSHNPPAPELLDLCDEMGIFVWDECFDNWYVTTGRGDTPLEEFVIAGLKTFVRRDRNHPSVFVWSIGNEIFPGKAAPPEQNHWGNPLSVGTTAERCARFRMVVRALDKTRPVGIASCYPEAAGRGDYDALDITGWNYRGLYGAMRAHRPDKPVVYSESASAVSDWGHYADKLPKDKMDYDVDKISVDSYDRNAAPWCDIADLEFERMERDRYVAGDFVWTGVDYLGEPTPFAGSPAGRNVPRRELARSSFFGVYDLLVMPKDRVWLYRSHWNKDAFTLHIVPDHWTFPEREGKSMPVYVYTSADEAELFLNGQSLGRRRKDPSAKSSHGDYYSVLPRYRLMWNDVKWQAGELKVIAYGADGKKLGEESVRTAGEAATVVLKPESSVLPDDRKEYVFVAVSLADAKGVPIPRDGRRVSFAVEGPGEIVSVGNSNPRGLDSFKDVSSHPLYNGRAGLYIRRTGPGKVRLTASAEGLKSATLSF